MWMFIQVKKKIFVYRIYMTTSFENGLFLFRRDLRVVDNMALNLLSTYCKKIYCVFLFTPEQVGSSNPYKSNASVQFMIESLEDLAKQIHQKGGALLTLYGSNETVVPYCIKHLHIDIVAFNLDVTPYSRIRDDHIRKLCAKMNVALLTEFDYYLVEPTQVTNSSGDPYKKFTPYYERARKVRVSKPHKVENLHLAKPPAHMEHRITLDKALHQFTKINPDLLVHGGRDNGMKQMAIAKRNIAHYSRSREELSKPTSHLSAYLKFGCVSIREVYHAFHSNHAFIRQLYWRDFYGQIVYHFPHVLGHALNPSYDKIKWASNERWFEAWKQGKTGIPLVDAAQRQLLKEGWVHNRGRMVSSSILTKILMVDWRKGEKFYAQHLVDYDVANNNGGWGWSAGVGSDAQPWFRYFNPYLQSKEHDPDCTYIKTYIPELKDVPAKDIHQWDTKWVDHVASRYPKPIVDYNEQKEKSLKMYKEVFG